MPGSETCARCHSDVEHPTVLCNECRTKHEKEATLALIKKDLHDALTNTGLHYITPELCRELILGVLKKHTQAGNILPLGACPFCGGAGELTTAVGESWVRCKTCNASGGMYGTVDLAVQAWNMRG